MNTKAGLFEIANNGTIFLDEVGELPLQAQVKLLRVIQEGEIEKIGRKESLTVNVRIIAATNKNLTSEVNEGRFREDLYYRLAVIPLDIVPLCKRGNDIILLFNHFLAVLQPRHRHVPAADGPQGKGNTHELPVAGQRP